MGGGVGARILWGRARKAVAEHSMLRTPSVPANAKLNPLDLRVRGASTAVDAAECHAASANAQSTTATIDGKSMAKEIRSEIAREVRRFKNGVGKKPGLAVVLIGSKSDSHSFVEIKMKACEEVGIASQAVELSADCPEDEVLRVVSELNDDPSIHGVIVQLPLPKHVDEEKVLTVIDPEKDVDGFHPVNVGNLALRGRDPLFIPSAAKACVELLLRSGIEIEGKNAVVIGQSKIVGLPTSLLLQRYHATVSVVNAFTLDPQVITREAEIVITDVGSPNVVRGSWLKPGSIVIDTGSNAVKDPKCRKGYHIRGDVCYEEAVKVASAITPVPGGVGPVTISMLLTNVLDSAKRAHGFV